MHNVYFTVISLRYMICVSFCRLELFWWISFHTLREAKIKRRSYHYSALLGILDSALSWISIGLWQDVCSGLETFISTLSYYWGWLNIECILSYSHSHGDMRRLAVTKGVMVHSSKCYLTREKCRSHKC